MSSVSRATYSAPLEMLMRGEHRPDRRAVLNGVWSSEHDLGSGCCRKGACAGVSTTRLSMSCPHHVHGVKGGTWRADEVG